MPGCLLPLGVFAGSRENCGKAAGGNEWGFWDTKERDRGNKSQHGSILAYEVVNYTDIYARHNQLRGRIYRSLPFPDYQRKIQARSWLEDGVQGTGKGHSMREHDFSRSKCLRVRARCSDSTSLIRELCWSLCSAPTCPRPPPSSVPKLSHNLGGWVSLLEMWLVLFSQSSCWCVPCLRF